MIVDFFNKAKDFILEGFINIMALIDSLIYRVLSFLYELFIYVGQAEFLADDFVQGIMTRLSLIIGIAMLFFLSFSLIQMLVNPDKLTDQKEGMGKLVTRAVITVVLLSTVSIIFTEAKNLQNLIIKSDLIGKVVTGKQLDINDENNGVGFSKEMFFSFVHNSDISIENESLANINSVTFWKSGIEKSEHFNVIPHMVNRKDGDNKYYFDYMWGISTVVGLIMCWIIISYIISTGVRVVQLFFLQIIAPIPILYYIMPKGKDKLIKWAGQCATTYIDLFIRLAIIYFVMYLIQAINYNFSSIANYDFGLSETFGTVDPMMLGWVRVVLVLALMIFAKKAPELLKTIFGGTTGNFMPRIKSQLKDNFGGSLVGGVIGGTLGGLGAASANAQARWQTMTDKNASFGTKFKAAMTMPFSAIGGAASGAARGVAGGVKEGVKAPLKTGAAAINAATEARRNRSAGYGMVARAGDRWTDMAKLEKATGTTSVLKNEIKTYKQQLENFKRDESTATMAMQNMMSSNYAAYTNAFRDSATGEYKKIYNNYHDYVTAGGTLSNNDYDNFVAAMDTRNFADKEAHKIEREISKREEMMTHSKGKK